MNKKHLAIICLLLSGIFMYSQSQGNNPGGGGGSSVSPGPLQVPAAVTSLNAFGDSTTLGSGVPTSQTTSVWANLVSQGWNIPYTNLAVAGARFYQNGLVPTAYAQTPSASTGSIALIGTNDTTDGSSAATQTQIGWAAQAMMIWLGLPSGNKVLASSMTQAGTWSTTTDFGLTSVFSSTANSTLTGTVSGTSVYVAGVWASGINMSFDVLIDGVSSCGSTCIVTWDLTAGGHYPWAMRFSGLSAGSHTVQIKVITGGAGNFADIQWIAGNSGGPFNLFEAYGGAMQRTAVANSNVTGTNAAFLANVNNLKSDGLLIYYVDDYSAISLAQTPAQYADDNLHPNVLGNLLIASKWFSTLGSARLSANSLVALYEAVAWGASPLPTAGTSGQTLISQISNSGTNVAVSTQAYQAQRVASCTTGASAGSTCNTTITWATAFANTSYTDVCTIDTPTNVPYVLNTSSKAAGTIVVTIANLTAAAASGTLNCFAIHD